MLQIQSPFQQLFDTNGSPLDDGYVYIGTANTNPETSPIAIYWDDAGTIPAAQPLRTLNGYIVRSGTPARVYTALEDFSMTVKDRQGRVVFSVLDATSLSNLQSSLASSSGSSLVGFLQAGANAQPRTVQSKLRDVVSVKDFGAVGDGVTDESAAANAMIAAHNYLYVPPNFTLICKNIQLFNNTRVICEGTLKLPNACSDFDRLLYAVNRTDIEIDIREIDGNYAGQSGNIGTHLIYTTGCDDISINVKYAHDHYIASGATMPSVDGIRNASSGGIFVYDSDRAKVNVGLFEGWGREAIWLYHCRWGDMTLGHAQGKYTTEYSGLQVEGAYNTVNRASVDFAGASAVGFDTRYGALSNVIVTNTRENSGVNFGHPSEPATGSVAENIVVDGTFGSGISVAASSHDVSINNFTVRNTGEAGISFSDGVLRGKLSNGVMAYPSRWGLVATGSEVQTSNLRSSDLDAATLLVNVTSGSFADGETVTSIGGSATIRKAVRNLTGTQQRLFFTSNVPASYVVSNAITGSGGASGTIAGVYVPAEYNESSGGVYLRDPRYFSGTGNQIRFPDGTAFYTFIVPCAHTTAGTAETFTQSFFSNVAWASAPYVVASVGSINSTNTFTLNRLSATATTSQITILLNASVNQTYGVQVVAIGRWK